MDYELSTSDEISIGWRFSTIPGTLVCEAVDSRTAAPVGVVYYRVNDTDKRIEVLRANVIGWARRKGIRSRINDWLLDAYKGYYLYSQTGTDDGTAFMKAYGYKKLKSGAWVYRRRRRG